MSSLTTAQSILVAIKNKLPFLLAGVIILSGLIDAASIFIVDNQEVTIPYAVAAAIKIGMGILIIYDPKRNLMRSVGFYALSLGLSRLATAIPSLGTDSDLGFLIAVILVGMGANLVISGYSYLQDVSRGRLGMTLSSAALALIMAATLFASITASEEMQEYFPEEDSIFIVGIIYLIQYLLILVILDSDEFRFSSWQERYVRKLADVRVTYAVTPGMNIAREDGVVIKHMFDDRSSWSPLDDGGPVECEKKLSMVEDMITYVMILQKWKDSDRIYVTMTSSADGTVLQANRFSVTEVVADDTDDSKFSNIRLYADGTMLSNLSVVSPKEVAA